MNGNNRAENNRIKFVVFQKVGAAFHHFHAQVNLQGKTKQGQNAEPEN